MNTQNTKYCLKFDLPEKNQMTSSEFMDSMSNVLIGFEELNQSLMTGISSELNVVSYIEDIEHGSIKIWLKDKAIPFLKKDQLDDNIRDLTSSVPALPFVLIQAKQLVLKWLDEDLDNNQKELKLESSLEPLFKNEQSESLNSDFFQQEKWDKEATKKSASKIINAANKMPKVVFIDNENNEHEVKGQYVYCKSVKVTHDEELEPQTIIGHIVIHGLTFDSNAKKWDFKYNNSVESIDISDVEIASLIVARGKVSIGDAFKVKMEVVEKKTKTGYKNTFKAVELIEAIWISEQQEDML